MAHVSAADEGDGGRAKPDNPLSKADEMRFQALVKEAQRAADQGRLNAAANKYSEALLIRMDPLIAGRLGLVLVHFSDARSHVDAAIGLYKAITEHAGESRAERKAFLDAYDIAQQKVCMLYVTTNDTNSSVQIDEGAPAKSFGRFWQYVAPGKHELVGTLEGHDEIRKAVDCPKGKRISVAVNFARKDAPIKTIEKVRDRVVFVESPSPISNADKISQPDTPKQSRLKFDAGPTMVFGVAPTPAFGVSLSSLYDLGNVAINLTTRGVYAIEPLDGMPLDRFSFSALGGPCKTWGWFRACGFAGINLIKSRVTTAVPDDFYTTGQAVPGFGIGIGTRHSFGRRLRLYTSGDAMVLTESTEATVYRSSGAYKLWGGSQFLASLSLGLEFAR